MKCETRSSAQAWLWEVPHEVLVNVDENGIGRVISVRKVTKASMNFGIACRLSAVAARVSAGDAMV